MTDALSIDVVSDVVCPWCFIGKRRLEGALDQWREARPDVPVVLRWHPFQLNPDMPAEGLARARYVQEKFGSRAASVYDRVQLAGREAGIDFAFERIARQPNTLLAHALILASGEGDAPSHMKEALLRAFFVEGRDIGDTAVLREIAIEAGMDAVRADQALDDAGLRQQVREIDASARSMGISGVPFFIFNRRVAVSGAHPSAQLFEAMCQASQAGGSS